MKIKILVFLSLMLVLLQGCSNRPVLKSSYDVGDVLYFGSYEQNNDLSNGKEEIEWIVLAKEDDRILVISKYALDCQQYPSEWRSSPLRFWLNEQFLNAAFSKDERAMIPSVTVTTSSDNNTTDQVFLLNLTEADKYFSSYSMWECQGTAYCYAQAEDKYSKGIICWWWLRPYDYESRNSVNYDGSVLFYASGAVPKYGWVRPALWINIEGQSD